MGLVLECFDTEAEMMAHVKKVAADIAVKSPITTRYFCFFICGGFLMFGTRCTFLNFLFINNLNLMFLF